MNKLFMVELIRYESLGYTMLRFYRKHRETKAYRNPNERAIARVAMAVMEHNEFCVRPFLAGEVGWVAERV